METQDHSEGGMDRTISRRSSSGVGSRSSRSTRSEDEVFTDAVTEFSESPAFVAREASGSGIQRYYSMQNENEVDDAKLSVESPIADNLYTTDLLKDSQPHTGQSLEGEKDKVEAGSVSAASTLGIEDAVDLNVTQCSESSSELDIVTERGKEIISSKDDPKLRTSYSETPEEGAEDLNVLKGACDEDEGASNKHMDSVSANVSVKTEIDAVESEDGFKPLDSFEKCKVESNNEISSPRNVYFPEHQDEAMNSRNDDTSKSKVIEEGDSKNGANENVCALTAHDALPLEQHPATAIEDLNELRSNTDFLDAPEATAKTVEFSTEVLSENVDAFSLEDKQSRNTQSLENKPDHISNAISSSVDNKVFQSELVQDLKNSTVEDGKDSHDEEKNPCVSQGGIFPEGTAMDGGDTTSNADSIVSNIEDDREYFTVMDADGGKISVDSLAAGNSAHMTAARDEVALQDLEHIHTDNTVGNDEKITVEGGIEDNSNKKAGTEGCVIDNGIDATLKTNNLNPTTKVDVDGNVESSRQSSASLNHGSSEKFSEDTACITEGDRVIKQPVAVSAIDTNVDSGSMTESLDGNWGSVSVMSATSDAIPTADTIALHHPQALEEENPSMVSEPVIDNYHSPNEVSIKPNQPTVKPDVEIEVMEPASNEPGRGNKGKEIIDKVANWDAGKQNTPLKTLLGEATARSRAESPIHHNHSSSGTSDVIPRINERLPDMGPNDEHPDKETVQEEMGKEWNSPARYPVDIKTEKRRSKSKHYWTPFLCCSSVNAR